MTPRDIYNLSKELDMTSEKMCEQYCEVYIGQDSRVPITKLKPRGQIKRCPLLKNRKCSVHRSKPAVCAMYPIGRCLMAGNKEHEKFQTKDIVFLLTATSCSDGSESHTMRDWLETFGIPVEDAYFVRWQNIIIELSRIFRKLEKELSMDTMQMAWFAAYAALYLHYDTKKKFMPQFEENARDYLRVLHTAFPE